MNAFLSKRTHYTVASAVFYVILILQQFSRVYNTNLSSFPSRIISSATASGIDVGARIMFYYEASFMALASFLVIWWLLVRFDTLVKKLRRAKLSPYFENNAIFALSVLGITDIFSHFYGATTTGSIHFIISVQFSLYLIKILKSFIDESSPFYIPMKNYRMVLWILLYSTSVMFVVSYVGKLINLHIFNHIEVSYLASFALSLVLVYVLSRKRRHASRSSLLAVHMFWRNFMPTLLLPIAIPVSNELYLVLSERKLFVQPTLIWIIISAALVTAQLTLHQNMRARPTTLSTARSTLKVFASRYYVTIIFVLCGFAYQPPMQMGPPPDLFESGNGGLAIQQLVMFGKIPLIQTFNAHGFSEIFSPLIFILLNGYHGWANYAYQGIILSIIYYTVSFHFLKRFLSEHLSMLLVMFFPFLNSLLPAYFSFSLLAVFVLDYVLRNPSLKRHVILWTVLSTIVLWRYDIGFAAVTSVIIVYMAFSFVYRSKLKTGQFVLASAIVGMFWSFIFIVLAVFQHVPIIARLKELHAIFASNQVWGYPTLGTQNDIQYIVFYLLLPLSTLGIGTVTVIRSRFRAGFSKEMFVGFMFIVIFTLMNFPRGLVRHSLVETTLNVSGYWLFILSFAALVIAYPRQYGLSQAYKKLLIPLSVVLFFVALSGKITGQADLFLQAANKLRSFSNYPVQTIPINRYSESEDYRVNTYYYLKLLFDRTLSKQQTFLDFSDSPYLYALTNRQTPMYINQTPAFLSDEVTQKSFLEEISKYSIPYVVYPETHGWSTLDGIPNYIRSYRVAEYIYRNYTPFVEVNGYGIWVQRKQAIAFRKKVEMFTPHSLATIYPKSLSPRALHFNDVNLHETVRNGLSVATGAYDPQIANIMTSSKTTPIVLNRKYKYYVKIYYDSHTQGDMQMFYSINHHSYTETYSAHAESLGGVANTAMFPIVAKGTLSDLRLDPPNSDMFTLRQVNVVRVRLVDALVYDTYHGPGYENDDLSWIPYYWGQFDPLQAVVRTPIEQTLATATTLPANTVQKFRLEKTLDKRNGNYLIINAKSPSSEPGVAMSVQYGHDGTSLGTYSFQLKPDGRYHDYAVRISSQYAWNVNQISFVQLQPSSTVTIRSMEIHMGD